METQGELRNHYEKKKLRKKFSCTIHCYGKKVTLRGIVTAKSFKYGQLLFCLNYFEVSYWRISGKYFFRRKRNNHVRMKIHTEL